MWLIAIHTYMGSSVSDSHVFKASMFSIIILDPAELSLNYSHSWRLLRPRYLSAKNKSRHSQLNLAISMVFGVGGDAKGAVSWT